MSYVLLSADSISDGQRSKWFGGQGTANAAAAQGRSFGADTSIDVANYDAAGPDMTTASGASAVMLSASLASFSAGIADGKAFNAGSAANESRYNATVTGGVASDTLTIKLADNHWNAIKNLEIYIDSRDLGTNVKALDIDNLVDARIKLGDTYTSLDDSQRISLHLENAKRGEIDARGSAYGVDIHLTVTSNNTDWQNSFGILASENNDTLFIGNGDRVADNDADGIKAFRNTAVNDGSLTRTAIVMGGDHGFAAGDSKDYGYADASKESLTDDVPGHQSAEVQVNDFFADGVTKITVSVMGGADTEYTAGPGPFSLISAAADFYSFHPGSDNPDVVGIGVWGVESGYSNTASVSNPEINAGANANSAGDSITLAFDTLATGGSLDLSVIYSKENVPTDGTGESVTVEAYLGDTLVYSTVLNASGTATYGDGGAGRATVSFDTGGMLFDSLKLSAAHVSDDTLSDVNDFLLNGVSLNTVSFADSGDQVTLGGSQDNLLYVVKDDGDAGDGVDVIFNFTVGNDKQAVNLNGHTYQIHTVNAVGGAAADTLITFDGVSNAAILLADVSGPALLSDILFV